MVLYIITWTELNSTFGMVGIAIGIEITEVVGKNSSLCLSMKNYLNTWSCSNACLQNFDEVINAHHLNFLNCLLLERQV